MPKLSPIKAWKKFGSAGSFSSASYLGKAKRSLTNANVRKNLSKSIIFQAHRDLHEKFHRRGNVATSFGEKFELDVADLGSRLDPNLTRLPFSGRRKQLLMLVATDVCTKAIFARALSSKDSKTIVSAFLSILNHLPSAVKNATPRTIETDSGRGREKIVFSTLLHLPTSHFSHFFSLFQNLSTKTLGIFATLSEQGINWPRNSIKAGTPKGPSEASRNT